VRGIRADSGKIFLTNKNVIFNARNSNARQDQTNIPFQTINEIQKGRTANLIDDRIRIITNNGKVCDFVVNERDLWFENLNKRIS